MDCITRAIEGLTFEVCKTATGIILKQGDRSATLTHSDLRSIDTLRVILDVNFDIDLKDPRNFRIADTLAHDKFVEALLKEAEPAYEEYSICIKFINGECAGTYIVANNRGIFLTNVAKGSTEEIEVSSLKIKKIEDLTFTGLDVLMGKFVRITTADGKVLTGTPGELTVLVESEYGLKRPNEFKFLLNVKYETATGYYAIGPWFDGEKLAIATESAYNPPWKKVTTYKLPPEIPEERKVEVLRRILATVNSYRMPSLVTWILSYGLMANFAHFFRQRYGYFPHLIIVGRRQTGKTTLTVLNQYLYWGNNPLPPAKPKTEAQLRQLLSQATLVMPVEEWAELASESDQVREMMSQLHSSAQVFVLKYVRTSNPDINGTYLSLTAVIGDTNFSQDIDVDSSDKVIFVPVDKEEGLDLKKAEEMNALLKFELKNDFYLHNVLHSIGLELLEVAARRLAQTKFESDREKMLDTIIKIGYQAWLEIFTRHGIKLKATIDGVEAFPAPELKLVEIETEEDIDLAFEEFITKKIKEIGGVPTAREDLLRYGFFFEGDQIYCSYAFLSEFKLWLVKEKGMRQRGFERLKRELGLAKTSIMIGGKARDNIFRRSATPPLINEDSS